MKYFLNKVGAQTLKKIQVLKIFKFLFVQVFKFRSLIEDTSGIIKWEAFSYKI